MQQLLFSEKVPMCIVVKVYMTNIWTALNGYSPVCINSIHNIFLHCTRSVYQLDANFGML